MKSVLKKLFFAAFFVVSVCYAQTSITVNLGEKASIPIKIDTTSTCNVEVTLAGKREQITVEPTSPQLLIPFEGTELGVFDLKWEGKFRARGLKSVAACDGGGMVKVSVVPNTEQRRAEWVKFFANLPSDSSRECVKVGLQQKALVFESIDPQARLESPSSPAARDVFAKCDSFLSARTPWGAQDKENFSCTVGGITTRCRGVYAERMPDGKLRAISYEDALRFHFEGRSWTAGQIETVQAKENREQQSRVAQERREAEIAANREAQEKARIAKIEADERERKFKESPEYKRQQAELERQKAAEAKAAEERARKEKEAAELAAKQQREEQEKRAKEAAARDRERRENFAKEFPYYAVITCGFQGQHMNILACFAGRVGTEIELRNGNEYGLYKVHEIGRLGQESQDGFRVNLRRNFELKVQNSSEHLTLGVVVREVKSEQVVFQKQVSRFGVISVRN
jgi:hypothetical protein